MGVRIALLVLTVFASAWAWAALWLSGGVRSLIVIPIVLSVTLLIAGWRGAGSFPSRGPRVGKVVALWSSIEVVALLIAANVLQNVDRGDLMLPAAAIIVGLHFFPLALGIPVRLYHATGAGLVFVGLVGPFLPAPERPMAVGMGAALVLWATALVVVLRSRQAVKISSFGS